MYIYKIQENRLKIKKECFIKCVFKKESFLFKLLNSYFFTALFSIVLAIVYTVFEILFVIKTDLITLIIIFTGMFLSGFLFDKFYKLGIKDEYNKWMAIGFVSFVGAFILSIILVVKNYYFSSIPGFLDVSLVKTYQNLNHIYYSNCWFMQDLLSFSNFLDSIDVWILSNLILNAKGIIAFFAFVKYIFVSFVSVYVLFNLYFFAIKIRK